MKVPFDVLLSFLLKKIVMKSVINGNKLFDHSAQLMLKGKANKKNPAVFIVRNNEKKTVTTASPYVAYSSMCSSI